MDRDKMCDKEARYQISPPCHIVSQNNPGPRCLAYSQLSHGYVQRLAQVRRERQPWLVRRKYRSVSTKERVSVSDRHVQVHPPTFALAMQHNCATHASSPVILRERLGASLERTSERLQYICNLAATRLSAKMFTRLSPAPRRGVTLGAVRRRYMPLRPK